MAFCYKIVQQQTYAVLCEGTCQTTRRVISEFLPESRSSSRCIALPWRVLLTPKVLALGHEGLMTSSVRKVESSGILGSYD